MRNITRSVALLVLSVTPLVALGQKQTLPTPTAVSPPSQVWSPEFDKYDMLQKNELLNVYNYTGNTNENTGTPGLHFYSPNTRLGNSALPPQYEMSGQCIPDGAGGDGTIVVFESMRQGVDDQSAGGMTVTPEGRRVWIRHCDGSGHQLWEKPAGDGTLAESMPKVVMTSSGNFVVAFKAKTSTGAYRLETSGWTLSGSNVWTSADAFGASYYDISEFSIYPDNAGNTAVEILNQTNSADTWNNVNVALVGSTGTTSWSNTACSDHTGMKWNPVIRFVAASSPAPLTSRVDAVWGDPRINGLGQSIHVQSYTTSGTPKYSPEVVIPGAPTTGGTEFYMEPCSGSTYGTLELIFFQDDGGTLTARAFDYAGTTPIATAWSAVLGPSTEYDLPCGLMTFNAGSGTVDPVFMWDSVFNHLSSKAGGFKVERWNFAASTRLWKNSSSFNFSAAVERLRSTAGANGYGVFTVVPDVAATGGPIEHFTRFSVSTGGLLSSYAFIYQHDWISPAAAFSTESEPVFASCVTNSKLNVLNLEYGFTEFQDMYRLSPNLLGTSPFTGDKERVCNAINSTLTYLNFDANTSTFSTVTIDTIQRSPIERAPSTSTSEGVFATVYENWNQNEDGSLDIGLSYRVPGGSFTKINATANTTFHPSGTAYNYIEPRVAVYRVSGGDDYAFISYIMVDYWGSAGPSRYTPYLNLFDLTTSSWVTTTAIPAQMDATLNGTTGTVPILTEYANYDLKVEPQTGSCYAVWGVIDKNNNLGMFGGNKGQLVAAKYDFSVDIFTAFGTFSGSITGPNFSSHDEVATCLNPDPTTPGIWVTWRDRDRNAIGLQGLVSYGALFAGGPVWHTSTGSTPPDHPSVTASPTWCMTAWRDWQNATGFPYIYGCNHTLGGAVYSAYWALTGTQLSTKPTGRPATWQADDPTLIANQPSGPAGSQGALLAYTELSDPTYALDDHQCLIRFIPADPLLNAGVLGTQQTLKWTIDASVTGDAAKSLYGYNERKPMFALMGTAGTNDFWPSNSVLCAFQTRPYTGTAYNTYELGNKALGMPMYGQNNIDMRVLNVDGAPSFTINTVGHACISAAANAQDLAALQWTHELGPIAVYTSHDNSDNFSGDIRMVNIVPAMFGIPTVTPSTLHAGTTGPCGTAYTGAGALSAVNPTFNESGIPLNSGGTAPNYYVSWAYTKGGPSVFSTNLPAVLNPRTPYDNFITYLPVNNCDVDVADEYVNVRLFNNGGTNEHAYFVESMANGAMKSANANAQSQALGLSVVPNPTRGNLTVGLSSVPDRTVAISILNVLGQVVQQIPDYRLNSESERLAISLSALPAGTYVLRAVQDDGAVASRTITLQK